jgi:hypothetical protein
MNDAMFSMMTKHHHHYRRRRHHHHHHIHSHSQMLVLKCLPLPNFILKSATLPYDVPGPEKYTIHFLIEEVLCIINFITVSACMFGMKGN